uniref:L1 transposable element RRM domain-containing protein n=1 Tax=Oryzias melastigma TaxID=30732 RepID=A0A3B3BLU5_ORYME
RCTHYEDRRINTPEIRRKAKTKGNNTNESLNKKEKKSNNINWKCDYTQLPKATKTVFCLQGSYKFLQVKFKISLRPCRSKKPKMPSQQQKLNLRRQESASKEASAKASELARKDNGGSPTPQTSNFESSTAEQMAEDIAKIYALLKETSEVQESKLNSIQAATRAVEAKLSDMSARLGQAESRIDFLEDANKAWESNPPATRTEVENLQQKIDDLENRSRRNNQRFVGFPEGCEGSDILAFMGAAIPELLKSDFPRGLEIDRAHRSLARRRPDGQPPRAIIVQLLRFQDRERIVDMARKMGQLRWKGHHIMIFPDYSKLVSDKREAFRQCKQLLHERKIKFSLMFPAVLILKMTDGKREFTDPKKALGYIRALPPMSTG